MSNYNFKLNEKMDSQGKKLDIFFMLLAYFLRKKADYPTFVFIKYLYSIKKNKSQSCQFFTN